MYDYRFRTEDTDNTLVAASVVIYTRIGPGTTHCAIGATVKPSRTNYLVSSANRMRQ